jgi:hypothetical protein
MKVRNGKPEVTDRFQDGRRRHVGNSSACYEMGNYRPISMKFDAQIDRHAEFTNHKSGSAPPFSR